MKIKVEDAGADEVPVVAAACLVCTCESSFCVVQDGKAMRKAMVDKVPSKIDIGPVYNVNPQHRTAYSGQSSRQFLSFLHNNNSFTLTRK